MALLLDAEAVYADGKEVVAIYLNGQEVWTSYPKDHGEYTGLLDDDHTQYLLLTGGTMLGRLYVTTPSDPMSVGTYGMFSALRTAISNAPQTFVSATEPSSGSTDDMWVVP